jgi:secondary thiamine-phosphate synthase enzyme
MGFMSFSLRTKERNCFINITSPVVEYVAQSGMTDGLCTVYVPHTTAGITINESADPAVIYDIKMRLEKFVPSSERYTHAEGNSDAHIKASLMGSSVQIPISGGKLVFGTWQGIFFCEFDGPRQRTWCVNILGK